jgi:glycerol kinase
MILAIDQGTTSTRAVIAGPDGTLTPILARDHAQHYPQPGWVEHDPEELIANLTACIEAALPHHPQAIGIDNQGESCLAWEADTGRPLTPVIVWQDARTQTTCDRLRADGAETVSLSRAGLPLDAYFSASKLGWIVAHVPEAQAAHRAGRLRLGTTDAFFLDRLTGVFATDVTTASRSGLMNLASLHWDAELCALHGVPMECLPPIRPTTGTFGTVRGLPVTASVTDQQAALHGHGCRAPGDTKITFGTGAFALTLTGALDTGRIGPLPTVAWQRQGEAAVYALDGGVYAASSAVNWARGLGLFHDWAQINAFASPPAIDRGLAFVPALAGLACPHWNRAARGAWLGMGLDTTPADLMQALLEGVAFRMAEVLAAMGTPAGQPVSIDGGMSANPWFCRFLAQTLQRPVHRAATAELTALGTAALAAHGAGRTLPLPAPGPAILPEGPDRPDRRDRFTAARAAVEGYAAAASPA